MPADWSRPLVEIAGVREVGGAKNEEPGFDEDIPTSCMSSFTETSRRVSTPLSSTSNSSDILDPSSVVERESKPRSWRSWCS